MLESVEGRTPFADRAVASLCGAIRMRDKYRRGAPHDHCSLPETKIALRRAMAGELPEAVLQRPKASFPLPFRDWLGDLREELSRPGPVLDLIRPEALGFIAQQPSSLWRGAWPVMNLALWARRWWG